MSRLALSSFGGLVLGATFWVVFGAIAAILLSRMPGGSRDGGGAMAGIFFVGPLFALLGLGLGAWITWRLLADPARTGAISIGLISLLAVLIIGVTIALRPTIVEPDDYPGQTADFEVEVRFPKTASTSLTGREQVDFQLRAGDGTDVASPDPARVRREDGRAVLPAAFRVKAAPRTKLLAVMKDDRQLMSSTLTVDGPVESTTGWSAWQSLEDGFEARWRLVVTSR
jgi:hypothetical protein